MIDCDCSCIRLYPPSCVREVIRRARKQHTCCECGDTIEPGQRYEYVSGVWDGRPDWHHTCLTCVAIREHYCPRGWVIGGLAEQIEACLGFDYRTVPNEEDDDG